MVLDGTLVWSGIRKPRASLASNTTAQGLYPSSEPDLNLIESILGLVLGGGKQGVKMLKKILSRFSERTNEAIRGEERVLLSFFFLSILISGLTYR